MMKVSVQFSGIAHKRCRVQFVIYRDPTFLSINREKYYSTRGIIFNFANGDAYATNDGSATVSRIGTRTNTVVATIGVGNRPVFLAFDFMNSFVYVTNQFSATVSMISSS